MPTLVETSPGTLVVGANPLTLAKLTSPIDNKLAGITADRVALDAASRVSLFTDENNATYLPVNLATFAAATVNGTATLASNAGQTTTRRGYRLPVALIQGKAALTIGAIVRNTGTDTAASHYLLGSGVNGSTSPAMGVGRARGGGWRVSAVPGSDVSVASYNAQQAAEPPVGEWFGFLAVIDYAGGSIRFVTIRGDASKDDDTGALPAFAGALGNSGTFANQGLLLGGLGGAADAATWDSNKFLGDMRRLDLWGSAPGTAVYSGSKLTPIDILKSRYRAVVKTLNG